MAIPTVQTSCECFSSVTPVFTFVSVCHIIATTSCCSPRTLSASWQSVARDTPVWQHQQLATAGKTRLAVDRVQTLIYIEKEFVFVSISNRNLWTNCTLEFLDKLDFLMGMRTWIGFGTQASLDSTMYKFFLVQFLFCRSLKSFKSNQSRDEILVLLCEVT